MIKTRNALRKKYYCLYSSFSNRLINHSSFISLEYYTVLKPIMPKNVSLLLIVTKYCLHFLGDVWLEGLKISL
jgi:hypothetical protein